MLCCKAWRKNKYAIVIEGCGCGVLHLIEVFSILDGIPSSIEYTKHKFMTQGAGCFMLTPMRV